MNIPVSYWRIIWLPWSPVCMALKSTWICMLSPIASRPLSGVTKNGSCTNSWNFASLLPMFRTRRVLVVAYWEDTTITWWVVPGNLDILANFLCNEFQSITNTAHICGHEFDNKEHVAKTVIFQFWIFKQQSNHLSNLWISLFNGKQHHIHSCNTLNVQLHVVRVINGKLRPYTFTGQVPKLISSGKSRIALAPIAFTGTKNFSLSVMQISSWV